VPEGETSTKYLSQLHSKLIGYEDLMNASASRVIGILEKYSVSRQGMSLDAASEFRDGLYSSLQKDLFDLPHPPRQPLYHDAGFRFGIGRILDVWSTGALALYLDLEMLMYLAYCEAPEKLLHGLERPDSDVLPKLNLLNNLPSLGSLLIQEKLDTETAALHSLE
jgi:hypothetical protein